MSINKINYGLLSVVAILLISGCNDTPSSPEAKIYNKSPAEIYTQSCTQCHGQKGEGNPQKKASPLNDRQSGKMMLDLYDAKNRASIPDHDMKKLAEKSLDYDPETMAKYLEKAFYIMPTPKVETAVEPVPVAEVNSTTETTTSKPALLAPVAIPLTAEKVAPATAAKSAPAAKPLTTKKVAPAPASTAAPVAKPLVAEKVAPASPAKPL